MTPRTHPVDGWMIPIGRQAVLLTRTYRFSGPIHDIVHVAVDDRDDEKT